MIYKRDDMKIVFAVDKNSFNNPDHAGVNIKVASQINQMKKAGHEVSFLQYEWVNGQLMIDVEDDTDILYFRRIESSVKLIKNLKRCKRKSRKLRIIMEIPTYPYKGEQGKRTAKQIINGIIGDTLLSSVVDRIALCGVEHSVKKVLGIEVIHFDNGVDFNSLSVNGESGPNDDINMICVSGCMLSHGYDRIIEGMHDYYSGGKAERNIYFHIVGTGEQYGHYVDLAQRYGLKDKYVFFHGRCVGKQLDEIYEKCNLAIAHLATHRIGVSMISSLKTREYAARGIPFVTSSKIDVLNDKTGQYILFVPDDETAVRMNDIIEFYGQVYAKQNVAADMRTAFYELCDWDYSYKTVLEYINRA